MTAPLPGAFEVVRIQQQIDAADPQLRTAKPYETPLEEVPDEIGALLLREKLQLRDLIWQALEEGGAQADAKAVAAVVQSSLRIAGARFAADEEGPQDKRSLYGAIVAVHVDRPDPALSVVIAVAHISIECGEDSALWAFELKSSAAIWRPVLTVKADNYSQIYDAFGWMDYKLIPRTNGGWNLIEDSITPACASVWQGLRYEVWEPGVNGDGKRLLDVRTGMNLNYDVKLKTERDGFAVLRGDRMGLDIVRQTRTHIDRYRWDGSTYLRIPPLALFPEDFLDEWASLPWKEAARWTSVPNSESARVEQWHQWLSSDHGPETSFDLVQRCGISDRYTVGLDIDDSGGERRKKTEQMPDEMFFEVSGSPETFKITRASPVRWRGCPGNTPPPERGEQLPEEF